MMTPDADYPNFGVKSLLQKYCHTSAFDKRFANRQEFIKTPVEKPLLAIQIKGSMKSQTLVQLSVSRTIRLAYLIAYYYREQGWMTIVDGSVKPTSYEDISMVSRSQVSEPALFKKERIMANMIANSINPMEKQEHNPCSTLTAKNYLYNRASLCLSLGAASLQCISMIYKVPTLYCVESDEEVTILHTITPRSRHVSAMQYSILNIHGHDDSMAFRLMVDGLSRLLQDVTFRV